MLRARHWMLASLVAAVAGGADLGAQAAAAPAPTPLNFSGIIFGSYNFQQSTTPNALNRQIDNAFIVDRAYLTFRMPAGDHTSIRITTDLYQTSDATPNAYTIRAKYAYLQYDASKMDNGLQFTGRIGILQNVVIDHQETFWPRYLSQVAVERAGYFASADVGVATQVALPNKMGEFYGTITNGPGYTSREVDRFKDYAARLSLTPLANTKDMPLLSTFTITAWGYKGATASAFVNGGAGTNGAVGAALDRSRAGLFAGIKDPRLVIAGEWARRHEGGELGANTVASPVATTETTGQLLSAYTVIRPFAFANESGKSPFGVVARYDHVKPTSSTTGFATAPSTDNAYHTVIAGMFWDLSQKAQLALDYQESLASNNTLSNAPPTPSKAYFAHFVVNF
jgi:hypothetical protein